MTSHTTTHVSLLHRTLHFLDAQSAKLFIGFYLLGLVGFALLIAANHHLTM